MSTRSEAPTRIPLSEPVLGEAELTNLTACISENWVATGGRFVAEFEAGFASRHDQPRALALASGTAALHLACHELGLGPGDEVLVPALTFAASANAVMYTGASPVFVDVEAETFGLDPAAAAQQITDRTRAIIVVHLYGHPVRMDEILGLASARGLAVIEDATEALGSLHRGRRCGTLGDVGCFSFNGNKVITAGGGGMVLARDPARLARMRHLSAQARVPGTREYLHDEVGFNYGLSNLHAAVGLAQLARLDELVARRRALAVRYAEGLADLDGLRFTGEAPWARSNRWLMSVMLDDPGRREQLITALAAERIEARPFFAPLPGLPPYGSHLAGSFPIADQLHARGVNIPSSANLSDEEQDRVIAALRRFF